MERKQRKASENSHGLWLEFMIHNRSRVSKNGICDIFIICTSNLWDHICKELLSHLLHKWVLTFQCLQKFQIHVRHYFFLFSMLKILKQKLYVNKKSSPCTSVWYSTNTGTLLGYSYHGYRYQLYILFTYQKQTATRSKENKNIL